MLARRFRLFVDLGFARAVAGAERGDPLIAPRAGVAETRGEALEEISGVADRRDVRAAIEAGLPGAAIGGDQSAGAAHMTAVVEAEVAWRAGEHDAVRLPQGLPASMEHLQRVVAAEQAARQTREIDRQGRAGRRRRRGAPGRRRA